ncbi:MULTISPECIES: methylenetetrahydrofolate--tRNA-(uracil(54)-C(5))-methyltransferase (FADH(2)-oxidizing) TrmFO [unclassified Breznakia]|uniref:methylenetetrahydrofolate--tRNA-(uracil(54)- C(5))-methyltransferase (FADH(2)-oxidizing) TrmFO n=1 Tax=unclassified Breznakia TaxID=2623764 RepID=UPI0024766EC8|nr:MULTISPECIES: methylenetetrahydrofolate--tRNA-(uracil(54)-C(5))-methyltransferase (FADH(2)-oxidizing) TrmFO [unclassified Breznakia]MDH6366728.1 methylenetetrahydrofolate--tRNA-(uracil-5-)-methyltransferase [Breznakia sp. PH1-1]MDH6403885.1 methylenetetrahydrofolate--tRNA-(uracil-5-)-methyltransferase [Breznakia sp. PF1-11]MDH6411594.1 methylenetetrahydrofolate--tRNA-(uracil-5-)-methyltransferase [Breznakia sp. PFB1-11]MDH6413958.1 methylenetetrahydrofolate--tRNA-(uracil-5-)-methyltransferas
MKEVIVIGAGLAGSEATWQLVKRGIKVKLYEMRPKKMTAAHHTSNFAELVCSNSLRSNALENAVGIMKEELRMLDSLIISKADEHQVPAGSALAVDRAGFSASVTKVIKEHPLVEVIEEELTEIPEGNVIVATGPLTSDALSEHIKDLFDQEYLHFYDAAAPIIEKDSIDFTKAYYKSRYDKGEADYINCPMSEEEFTKFYQELIHAEVVVPKDFEDEKYFEGCMPFEEIAKRGEKTLLFGPMKPVGLEKDENHKPYAVVQLRQDDAAATLYNIVGFQTHLKWPEQKRILQMIPGLENCEIVRYGVMHRNTFMCAPKCLKQTYQSQIRDNLFFAGQMCGVEGYVESTASGALAGINMARLLEEKEPIVLPPTTAIGAQAYYITHTNPAYFQPMNANFGIMQLESKVKKRERKAAYAKQAIEEMQRIVETL